LQSNGGKVLIRADVDKLLFDQHTQRVVGVRLKEGTEVRCKVSVVSSTGYLNTMNNLLDPEVAVQFGVSTSLPVCLCLCMRA
jgi:phytoene dehydrogenase-like protein